MDRQRCLPDLHLGMLPRTFVLVYKTYFLLYHAVGKTANLCDIAYILSLYLKGPQVVIVPYAQAYLCLFCLLTI